MEVIFENIFHFVVLSAVGRMLVNQTSGMALDMENCIRFSGSPSRYSSVGDVLFFQLFSLFLVGQYRSGRSGSFNYLCSRRDGADVSVSCLPMVCGQVP